MVAVPVVRVAASAGTFDSVTMAAFRSYWQREYRSEVLLNQFGISAPATFDFGQFIRANGLSDRWNRAPLTGLALEFFLFKPQESLALVAMTITIPWATSRPMLRIPSRNRPPTSSV